MVTHFDKQQIVYEFLNCLPLDFKQHWHISIDDTYNELLKEQSIAGYCIIGRDVSLDTLYHFIKI